MSVTTDPSKTGVGVSATDLASPSGATMVGNGTDTVATQLNALYPTTFSIADSTYIMATVDAAGFIVESLSPAGVLQTAAGSGSTLPEARAGVNSYTSDGTGLLTIDKTKNAAKTAVKIDGLVSAYASSGFNQREPSVVHAGAYRCIVFNVEFSIDGSGGDGFGASIVYRTATYDPTAGTVTVGSRTLLIAPTDNTYSFGYIMTCRLKTGRLQGRIVLLYGEHKSGVYQKLWSRYSDDNGATWSAAVEWTSSVSAFDSMPVLGTSGGITEIPYGPFKGRLVVPLYSGSSGNKIALAYSDDQGVTWSVGAALSGTAFGVTYINETAVSVTHTGELFLTSRSDPNIGYDLISRSTDGGKTLIANGNTPNLHTTQCAMSLCQMAPAYEDGVPKIIWTAPAPAGISNSRLNPNFCVSYDGGHTFPTSYFPFTSSTPFGYSSICALDDSTFAVAYETPVGGVANTQESIRLLIANMAEVYQHAS
jgi:hypothetical protein